MCDKYVCKYDSHLRARQMCYKYSANVIPVYKHVNVYGCFIFATYLHVPLRVVNPTFRPVKGVPHVPMYQYKGVPHVPVPVP